jgi:hypothetical protein
MQSQQQSIQTAYWTNFTVLFRDSTGYHGMAQLVPEPDLNGPRGKLLWTLTVGFRWACCGLGLGGSGQELPNDVKPCFNF